MTRAGSLVRVVLAPALVTLLLAGCTASLVSGRGRASVSPAPSGSSTTTPPTTPEQRPADFTDCPDSVNGLGLALSPDRADKLSLECATIDAPLDYADPTGRKIRLQLLRIHDRDNHAHTGSLIVNPGGPGGSGVDLALGLARQISDAVLTHFDLIGFDPRGVGLSSPITCVSDKRKEEINAASPDLLTPTGFAQDKRIAKAFARACVDKYGSALAEFDTVQTAKDMDRIRQAVGDAKMNYLGFSYGSELGAQYIHLFPANVRVAVLDGAVDPLTDPITTLTTQVKGFEDAFDEFAAWCRTTRPCSSIGDPRTAVYQIIETASRSPIASSAPGETRKATSNLVVTGVSQAMYAQSEWSTLGSALVTARAGDAKGLLDLADEYNQRYDGRYTNLLDAFNTIDCNDSGPGPTDATIRALVRSWSKRFPIFGMASARSTGSLFWCQQWQPDRSVPPVPTAPTTSRKVLVVGNLHDPATPYQGAKDLAKTLGNAELLTWDGEGHTSYLQGSSCVDDYVNNYLIDGTLPPAGTTCPR
jgi:pimeloyl-ACP methyl ester carboxylesterase